MGINASNVKSTGGNFTPAEPMEAGNYPCRIVQVIDLGLQAQRPWKGEEKAPAHEIMVTYEFTDEFLKNEDGTDNEDKPRWLSENFPLRSLKSELAKSTKRMLALDPNGDVGGDWSKLVGAPCMVTVVNSEGKGANAGRTFNNVGNVSAMRSRDADRTPDLVNPPKVLDLDNPDLEVLGSLPEWLQEKIKGNLEYKGSVLEARLAGGHTGASSPTPTPQQPEPSTDDGEDIPW
ncbi:hypothetical protein NVP1253O_34 [Vibrio phage 1.253.O._10N.286.45.B12]|nr:hypothetical protein NVP1253O_34 [Vibrio phage 1.253.O._10N.286.45.B12]